VNIPEEVRRLVRERANSACEYCGVTESDTGGELTVDHFRPQAANGGNEPDNLLYCCYRCNQYKSDYWPTEPDHVGLWNPRREPMSSHLLLLADGRLYPITAVGTLTLAQLRLNRPALVAYRLRERSHEEEQRLLQNYRDALGLIASMRLQEELILREQQDLLAQLRGLVGLLLQRLNGD